MGVCHTYGRKSLAGSMFMTATFLPVQPHTDGNKDIHTIFLILPIMKFQEQLCGNHCRVAFAEGGLLNESLTSTHTVYLKSG